MQRDAAEPPSSTVDPRPQATTAVREPTVRATRRRLLVALALSLVVHALTSLWRAPDPDDSPLPPLQVELRDIPPPPAVAAPPPPPRVEAPAAPRPARLTRPRRPPDPMPTEPSPAVQQAPVDAAPADADAAPPAGGQEGLAGDGPPAAAAATPLPAAEVPAASGSLEPAAASSSAELAPVESEDPARTLPPVVDLMYSAFYGPGLLVGTVGYRFERDGRDYRIETLGRGAGLVALLYPGVLKVTSRGEITASGLLPDELVIERGGTGRRESTRFDRPGGLLVLHQKEPQPLNPPTYDLLTFWLRFYFAPPTGDEVEFRVATTRTLREFKLRRGGEETVVTALGEVPTNVWRRVRREDGEDRLDVTLWLAPQWHQLPVKVRLAGARGSVEQVLLGVRAGLDVPESMRQTRRLELPLDQNGEFVQEDRFNERAHTP